LEDSKKLKLIGQLAGVKVPYLTPCLLIDPKGNEDPP
jgi:hypothetical protein